MPIYEYECGKCKGVFEYTQSITEAPKKKCEKCGGKLERLISSTGFILKGGGWYKDLYASSKATTSSSSDSSASSSDKSESKSETKTEAKVDKPAKASKKKG